MRTLAEICDMPGVLDEMKPTRARVPRREVAEGYTVLTAKQSYTSTSSINQPIKVHTILFDPDEGPQAVGIFGIIIDDNDIRYRVFKSVEI